MLKKVIIFGLLLAGCSSQLTRAERTPSATDIENNLVNPITKNDFWTDFSNAKDGHDSEDQHNEKFKIGVLLNWLLSSPSSVVEGLQGKPAILKIEIGNRIAKIGPRRSGTIYVLHRPEDIRQALAASRNSQQTLEAESLNISDADLQKNNWQNMSAALFDQESYVGKDIEHKAFGRIDVSRFARRFSYGINERFLGFAGLNLKQWTDLSQAILEERYFNPLGYSQIAEKSQQAQEALKKYITYKLSEKNNGPVGTYLGLLKKQGAAKYLQDEKWLKSMMNSLIVAEANVASAAVAVEEIFSYQMQETAHQYLLQGRDQDFENLVKEAIRVHPWRAYQKVDLGQELAIDGQVIPAHSDLILVTAALQFDGARLQKPYRFMPERWSGNISGLDQEDNSVAVAIAREIFLKASLNRADGYFGLLNFKKTYIPGKLKDVARYSFPQKFALEFLPAPNRTLRVEIPDSDYPYEEYLQSFDRISYRQCLSGLSKLYSGPPNEGDSLAQNLKEMRYVLLQAPAIVRSFRVTKKNVSQENLHLFYCRLPVQYRKCMNQFKVDIQDPMGPAHEKAYKTCQNHLRQNEDIFYRNVFFNEPLAENELTMDESVRLQNEYEFEDYLKFYSRYRARESMLNPAGFSMDANKLLFYVRLNIDFRMCLGGPVIKNKFTLKHAGQPKEIQYEICKNGTLNPVTFQQEGELSLVEKYFYEKIMLERNVTYEEIKQKERPR